MSKKFNVNSGNEDDLNGIQLTSIKTYEDTNRQSKSDYLNRNNSNVNKQNGFIDEPKKSKRKEDEEENDQYGDGLTYFHLFRYAVCGDVIMLIFGVIGAIGVGCGLPVNFLIFGNVINEFIAVGAVQFAQSKNLTIASDTIGSYNPSGNSTTSMVAVVFGLTKWFLILAAVFFFAALCQMVFWQYSALRQARRIRFLLFRSILYQDVTWQDKHTAGDLVTRLSDQVNSIENGIGEKMAVFIQYFSTFVLGLLIGFIKGWKLALVAFSVVPLIGLSLVSVGLVVKRMTAREIKAYGVSGTVAEEVLYAIRTVVAFGGEKREVKRYSENLHLAQKMGIVKSVLLGIALGCTSGLIYTAAALSFWYGGETIIEEKAEPGVVIQVFFCTLIGGVSLGNAFQSLEDLWNAIGAARNIFAIIERKPEINVQEGGEKLESMQGRVEFRDVKFTYPTRPDVQVLKGLSFTAKPGETIALVGESGSGKSTVIQLLQRFYDCDDGQVLIDGRPLSALDLSWFREHVGAVQQEPLLFAGTVVDNIRLGRLEATDEEVEEAAKMANAHDFINRLPLGYKTVIGEGGGQLSGGQKQRVAIARALIRRPRLLLLDEATSALDNRSEAMVQAALDKASASRDCTVLMIAHRLTTVRNADKIIVMRRGCMVEQGNHEQLMAAKGEYYRLVTKQDSNKEQHPRKKSRLRSSGFQGLPAGETLLQPKPGEEEEEEEKVEDAQVPDTKVVQPGEEDEEGEAKPRACAVMTRALALNRPEGCYIALGVISSLLVGAMMPAFSVIYSEILHIYSQYAQPDLMRSQTRLYCIILGIAAIGSVTLNIMKNWSFGVSGERLTVRMRALSFEAMLNQEIGWFDQKENQAGVLTARLATDASFIKAVTGVRMGMIGESLVTLSTSIIIAFISGWKLTLVTLAFIPILIGAGILQGRRFASRSGVKTSHSLDSSSVAQEAIGNIRTVISLNREEHFYQKYVDSYMEDTRTALRRSFLMGLFAGITQGVLFSAYAAVFTYGASLVENKEMEFYNVFRVFTAITFGSTAMGRSSAFVPDFSKALRAAQRSYNLLDRQPLIRTSNDEGKVPSAPCSGVVQFGNVEFAYPTRPDINVLEDLSVEAQRGETVALVGESGCGKSTLMQLLLRFYDAGGGSVRLDGEDVRELNVPWLRAQIGLVSQEPTLFNLTVRENIAYGDNRREVPMVDVIDAARKANIHEFIISLPKGYDTQVGARGGQMSGGQKQRIAIARALVRNPTVLLLDEATSALDSESERVVQEALDSARKGRTCLVIAHRLSTVESADRIAVIDDGQVVEQGTHRQLIQLGRAYFQIHGSAR